MVLVRSFCAGSVFTVSRSREAVADKSWCAIEFCCFRLTNADYFGHNWTTAKRSSAMEKAIRKDLDRLMQRYNEKLAQVKKAHSDRESLEQAFVARFNEARQTVIQPVME